MDADSQKKVIEKGFKIIRKDDHPSPRIKIKGQGIQEWKTFEKYPTKAARDRAFKDFLLLPDYIND